MNRCLLAALVALGLAAGLTKPALAAPPEERRTGLSRRDGRLLISLGLHDLFTVQDAQHLQSGFSSRVLVRVLLYRMDDPEPVAQALRQTEIVFDLWDEKFRVRRSQSGGKRDGMEPIPDFPYRVETRETRDVGEAIDLATILLAFPVADLGTLEPGVSYRLSIRADLNPISQEMLADVRRWLSRPTGRTRMGTGDGFFGSFVSAFVNPRIDDSERQLRVVSQVWLEPPR